MEQMPPVFYEAVRDGYLTLARDEPRPLPRRPRRPPRGGRRAEEIWLHAQALLGSKSMAFPVADAFRS